MLGWHLSVARLLLLALSPCMFVCHLVCHLQYAGGNQRAGQEGMPGAMAAAGVVGYLPNR